MLLRFRAANVRSLRDVQELSFVAPEAGEDTAARQIRLSDDTRLPVYTVLGIFGANASGKSNVIKALKQMKDAVLSSYAAWTSYEGIARDEFALDTKAASENTYYEADFVLDDVRWTYGFELGSRRVEAEWLYEYPKGQRRTWYERDASRERVYDFPAGRLQDRNHLARTTRANALLLTRAANDGHSQLTPVYDWFNSLWDVTPETERKQREAYTAGRLLESEEARHRVEELLRVADLGIAGAEVELAPDGPPLVRLRHAGEGAEAVSLDWEQESFGTRSWFALIGPVLLALDRGAILLVDELDSSLHSRFAAEVLRLFQTPWVNPKGAQLVFTAHDPSLLRTPGGGRLLDPGQVWLTQKDKRGATELFPVSDWEPGEEEDLMSSYLAGSFGGVPKVTEGQVGRRLLQADATSEAEVEEG